MKWRGGVAVLLVVGLGWTGDRVARQLEYGALLDAAELADDPAVWEPYLEAYTCPLRDDDDYVLRSSEDSDVVRFYALLDAVEVEAGPLRAELIRRLSTIEGVLLMPWHRSMKQAREALVSHERVWIDTLGAQIGHLTKTDRAQGGLDWLHEVVRTESDIHGTFQAAEDAFLRAQPRFDWFGLDFARRRAALFAHREVTCPEE